MGDGRDKGQGKGKGKARDYFQASPGSDGRGNGKGRGKSKGKGMGQGKHSESRQGWACQEYAENHAITILQEASGTEPPINRAIFSNMVSYGTHHGVEMILVESDDRFARDLVVQETVTQWLSHPTPSTTSL